VDIREDNVDEMSPLDAVLWAWTSSRHPKDLAEAVNRAVQSNDGKNVQVAFETVFATSGTPFDHLHPRSMREVERSLVNGVEFLKMTDSDGPWTLASFPTRHQGVYHLVSGLPLTHSRWQRVERWVNNARNISRCYLNHDDFSSIGDRLSEFGDVEVVKLAARVVKDGSSINRGFPAREGILRPSHHDEIAEVEGLGATVRTLTLSVAGRLYLHVRRVAGATFYSGDYRLFEEQVLSRLEDATAARRTLLTGRARESIRENSLALRVLLPEPILQDAHDTGDVLAAVRSMTNVTMSIFHRNPYLHLTVTDEFDGSNFDVMVTQPDAIDIYPGYRASATALARVAQRLGERFGAQSIDDAPARRPVSVFELMKD